MSFRQVIAAIAITMALTLVLYLLVAYSFLHDTPRGEATRGLDGERQAPVENTNGDEASARVSIEQREAQEPRPRAERETLEVYGSVLDPAGIPIDDVLVTVERHSFVTRSDDRGHYIVHIRSPGQHLPVLVFQRREYRAKRIQLKAEQIDRNRAYELDVSLEPSSESVDLRGWVGNELGVGLEGAWVGLTSDDAAEAAQTYRTVYTDEHGDFVFEGIIAGENYKLSVNLNPDYPYYEEPGFVVSQTPGPVEIVLPRLHYADFDGMILDRELRPVPGYEIYISNLSTGYHVRKIVSDSSGFFRLEHFPVGEVSLTTQGREHLKATGLMLSDDAYRNLEIVIDRGDLYLSGWVNDRGGTSVENALITLQRSYRRGAVEYRSYRSRTTGNNGRFAFTGLGGGEYQVSVFATGYRQLVFSHRLETQADEINVTLQKEEAGDS